MALPDFLLTQLRRWPKKLSRLTRLIEQNAGLMWRINFPQYAWHKTIFHTISRLLDYYYENRLHRIERIWLSPTATSNPGSTMDCSTSDRGHDETRSSNLLRGRRSLNGVCDENI